jgi:hypothetical protein
VLSEFRKVSRLRPISFFLGRVKYKCRRVWRISGMIVIRKSRSTRRKPRPSAFFHHKFHMGWTGLKSTNCPATVRPLNTKINQRYLQKFSSFVTDNAESFHYKDQSMNYVQRNGKRILRIRITRNTNTSCGQNTGWLNNIFRTLRFTDAGAATVISGAIWTAVPVKEGKTELSSSSSSSSSSKTAANDAPE